MPEIGEIIRSMRACCSTPNPDRPCEGCIVRPTRRLQCIAKLLAIAAEALETAVNGLAAAKEQIRELKDKLAAAEDERDTYKRSADFERGWRQDLLRKQEADMARMQVLAGAKVAADGQWTSLREAGEHSSPLRGAAEGGVDYKAIVDGIAPLAHIVGLVYEQGRRDGARTAKDGGPMPTSAPTNEKTMLTVEVYDRHFNRITKEAETDGV